MTSTNPTNSHLQYQSRFQTRFPNLQGYIINNPYPAFSLSFLFLISAPFSINSNGSIHSIPSSPSIGSSNSPNHPSSSILSSLRRSFQSKRPVTPLPPFYALVTMAAVFGGGGYIIQQGDSLNGSGTVSAWSILYLLFRTIPSLKKPTINGLPIPILLTTSTLILGLGLHGSHYFDRTSWKGVFPDRELLQNSGTGSGTGPGTRGAERRREKSSSIWNDDGQVKKEVVPEIKESSSSRQPFNDFYHWKDQGGFFPTIQTSNRRKFLIEKEMQSRRRNRGTSLESKPIL